MALFEVELVEQACLLRCVVGLLTLGPSTRWQVSLLRDLALGAGHIAESALELDLTEVAAIAEGLRDAAVALRTAAESSVLDTRSASALTAAIEAMPPAFRALDEGRRLPPAACDLHLERLATLAAGARL